MRMSAKGRNLDNFGNYIPYLLPVRRPQNISESPAEIKTVNEKRTEIHVKSKGTKMCPWVCIEFYIRPITQALIVSCRLVVESY